MTKYRLKKDMPDLKAGQMFTRGEDEHGNDCLFAGGAPLPAFDISLIENFDEWFDRVDDKQWINDVTSDVSTNKVQLEFADDMEAIDFQNFIRAVKLVSNDAGFMTRGSSRLGWAIYLKDDGQLGITVINNSLAGGFCFEWSSDAEASIKNHPDEWKTIAKYKWGK